MYFRFNCLILKIVCRNHPINCDQHPKLDLYQWKDKPLDSDELPVKYAERELTETVDDTLVKEAWRKAEDDVSRRKQTEFLLWSKSNKLYC